MDLSSRGTAGPPPAPRRSRLSRVAAEWPVLLVLLVVAAGMTASVDHHWRMGVYVLGLAVLVSCLLRAILPDSRVGMLRVRSRRVDVAQTAVLGVALLTLAAVIPSVLAGS